MENKKTNGFIEFWKRVWNWIKEKAINFWNWLKAVLFGIKWISKKDYDKLVEQIKANAEEVWEKADVDKDGWITTKDVKDWFSDKKHEKEEDLPKEVK